MLFLVEIWKTLRLSARTSVEGCKWGLLSHYYRNMKNFSAGEMWTMDTQPKNLWLQVAFGHGVLSQKL